MSHDLKKCSEPPFYWKNWRWHFFEKHLLWDKSPFLKTEVLGWPKGSFGFFRQDGSAAAAAESLQSCPTLCDPTDGSPPGSPSLGFSRQEHWSGLPFLRESVPRQVDRESRGPQGERGLEFSRRKKGQTFFLSPHSLGLFNNNVSCLRTVFGLNLLLS